VGNRKVAWEDNRSGSYDIYGARVSIGGSVLDPGGIAISTAVEDQLFPAIAFDGTNYLVVWVDHRSGSYDIYGARVSVGGGVLDPGGIAICTETNLQRYPAIAFDGTNYLVVWEDVRSGTPDIYGARVTIGGSVLDPGGIAISTAAEDQLYPAIAFDGTNYLVAWQDRRSGFSYDIYEARVSAGGSVLDPGGIAVSNVGDDQNWPAIAFDGTNYLVVWEDWRSLSYSRIYGARVSKAGTVLYPGAFTDLTFSAASATAEQDHVTLSWQMVVDAVPSSFRIERSESPEEGFVTLDLPISMSPGFSFSCTDYTVQPGKIYWYRIVLVGPSGEEESYGPIEVRVDAVPTAYRAYQSYPNPFNPVCTIRYDIPRAGRVSLRVLDVRGTVVRALVDGWRELGMYSEVWDGRSDEGGVLPSGVYFYSITAGDFVATRKMVLLR